jgi:hypothetical protein
MADHAFLVQLSKKLTDEGKLIEAGFVGLRLAGFKANATPEELNDARIVFFAGASHLFSSIMTILAPGTEPTDKDLDRMSKIHEELERFLKDFKLRYGTTLGSA